VLGETLFEYMIRKKRLSEGKAAAIAMQLLSAVAYLTRHKIMHRDLKPENVLIDDAFTVRIIDFGLASLYEGKGKHVM
jgi:carbon catabolite-derepressing protein kinase